MSDKERKFICGASDWLTNLFFCLNIDDYEIKLKNISSKTKQEQEAILREIISKGIDSKLEKLQ